MSDQLHQDMLKINGLDPNTAMACIFDGAADGCVTDVNGECTVPFGCLFPRKPGVVCMAVEPGSTMPVIFKVKARQTDGQGNYTGCTIQARRVRTLPAVIALLTVLISYDPTEVAAGVEFSRMAMVRLT